MTKILSAQTTLIIGYRTLIQRPFHRVSLRWPHPKGNIIGLCSTESPNHSPNCQSNQFSQWLTQVDSGVVNGSDILMCRLIISKSIYKRITMLPYRPTAPCILPVILNYRRFDFSIYVHFTIYTTIIIFTEAGKQNASDRRSPQIRH